MIIASHYPCSNRTDHAENKTPSSSSESTDKAVSTPQQRSPVSDDWLASNTLVSGLRSDVREAPTGVDGLETQSLQKVSASGHSTASEDVFLTVTNTPSGFDLGSLFSTDDRRGGLSPFALPSSARDVENGTQVQEFNSFDFEFINPENELGSPFGALCSESMDDSNRERGRIFESITNCDSLEPKQLNRRLLSSHSENSGDFEIPSHQRHTNAVSRALSRREGGSQLTSVKRS